MTISQIGALLGGLGLFLLGMTLLTDGLKMAAGASLRGILGRWTRSRPRALAAGFLVTALVQSSSAVTVAAIGFVNAGLMTFTNSVWVLFGANVGTTMTAWIVSLVGLKLKIAAAALPAIGVGVLLRLTGGGRRRAAYGDVLAGFGLFFLGISVLSDTFAGYADGLDIAAVASSGFRENLAFLGLGFLVTVLAQSSSASIAIALTAAASGLIPLHPAAAMVIGANLGTTSTGLFAVIGATPPAKRVAASHLLFNVLTGAVALALLPGFIALVQLVGRTATLPENPAVFLALFHTVFNVVGVVLMWPVAGVLVTWLAKRFVTQEEDESRLHYLDDTSVAVPTLAAVGVVRELDRLAHLGGGLLEKAVSTDAADAPYLRRRADVVTTVSAAVGRFIGKLYAGKLPVHLADGLVHSARALQHYDEAAEITRYLESEIGALSRLPESLHAEAHDFSRLIADTARATGHGATDDEAASALDVSDALRRVKDAYRALKDRLLAAGAARDIDVETLDGSTRTIWHMRRAGVQLIKARRRIELLRHAVERAKRGDEPPETPPASDAGDEMEGAEPA